MKIIFFISGLSAGGAERVLSILVNNLVKYNYKVILITTSKIEDDFYCIDKRITRISLYAQDNINMNIYLKIFYQIKKLREIVKIENPNILVSFMSLSNIFFLLATFGLNIPIVIAERNNPKLNPLKLVWKILKELTFPFADAIVVQTERVKKEYTFFIEKKLIVIPNPLDSSVLDNITEIDYIIEKPSIIAVGRLHKLKGMDLLIKAFAIFVQKNEAWKLIIIGEGEERERLESLIESLNIQEKVFMPGRFTNPIGLVRQADIYVLPSRTEGFPNALCEAMSIGMPSISYNCPVGPAEIIQHNINGILVEAENIELLAQEMDRLANNKLLCKNLSEESIKLKDTLAVENIIEQWLLLFENILHKKRKINNE